MKAIYDKSLSFSENGKILTMLSLTVPKLFLDLFAKLLGTVNAAMLSAYSDAAVAAVSVSNSVSNVALSALDAFGFGASILVSLALGRRDRKAAGHITFVAIVSALAVSLVTGFLLFTFAEPLLIMMNADEQTLLLSLSHFKIRALFLPVFVFSALFGSLLICNGHSLYSFLAGVAVSILNVVGTYIALYGGVTDDPVAGIAISGVVVTAIGLLVRIVIFILVKCPFAVGFRPKVLGELLMHGVPGKMSVFSYTFAQTFTTGFVVALGATFVSSKVYIQNIISYVPTLNAAIAASGAILIGRFRGAGNIKNVGRLYRRNVAVSLVANIILSTLAYIFHRPLLSLFTKDESIIAVAGAVFLVDIGVEVFRAINQVSETALNACGRVRLTLAASTISCWAVSVGLSFVFSVICGWGLVGIWLAFLLDEFVRAVFYIFVWYFTLGKSKQTEPAL